MKGATARYLDLSLYNYHFNPRPREGSDAPILDKPEINIISIHAPVKGATREEQALIYDYEFQSTLPRRERPFLIKMLSSATIFQSTLPRRERRVLYAIPTRTTHFNPRSREGSDIHNDHLIAQIMLFQSTLPRRERRHDYQRQGPTFGFQSTLPRRERPTRSIKR